uniref:Arf-GAP domain-containing protein n=1 Tax=Peronospora matthiolae TaxID=2874970 RepID=A0AAV1T3V3_9STRA
MTTAKSVPSEKRQEERLIQKLRDFQRSQPPNKRCFDCNEMMPQYVCLDFHTFVCTACSGIHREFAHRVKSISMSKFTEKEVQQLIDRGGNEAAQKYWRSRHDPTFRPNGGNDGERTRNFIRLTYIDRKWVDEPAEDNESKRPSKKSSKKKVKKHDSDDIIVPSSAKLAPCIADSEFGDFSKFEGSSQTAATVARSFEGFGSFDDSAPDNKDSGDFTDFGDFEGSSGSTNATQQATSTIPTSSQVSKFSSFKMPPPPGSIINASNASKTIAVEDLMGLSSPQQDNNPFGFNAPAPASVNASHPTSVDSSPFHFDAPTPTRSADGLSSAASLDPLSDMTAAASPAKSTESGSPFDAFDPPLVSSSPSVFDAFAAPSLADGNAFGAVGVGEDAFGDFTGSTSSSRTDSVLDPFSSTAEHPAPTAADPFAAFENTKLSIETAPTAESAASAFGPSTGLHGYNSVSLQQSVMEDPFGFVSGTDSNNGGFTASQQQQRSGTTSQLYGGFPQQQQPQNAYGMQMQQPMQLLPQGQPVQQRQQWYGQQQGYYGQQQLMQPTGQQYNGQFPPYVVSGAHPAPIPVKTPASVTTINDPFASLNISNLVLGGTNDSTSGNTTTSTPATQSKMSASFGVAPTIPVPSGSLSYAQPQTRMNTTFPLPTQNTTFDAFGDYTSAPASAQAADSPANPFDMF